MKTILEVKVGVRKEQGKTRTFMFGQNQEKKKQDSACQDASESKGQKKKKPWRFTIDEPFLSVEVHYSQTCVCGH